MPELRPGWCHCMCNTYGTWLPGDPRGFRTRHHRQHVTGDYKHPPPAGEYEGLHRQAKASLARPPVVLSGEARRSAVAAVHHALLEVHGLQVLAIAVSAMHLHLLARFPAVMKPTASTRGLRATDPVRHYVGIAKKESAKTLVAKGLASPGGVWARRGKIVRVHDRRHQVNVLQYIVQHQAQGAAVWSFRESTPTD